VDLYFRHGAVGVRRLFASDEKLICVVFSTGDDGSVDEEKNSSTTPPKNAVSSDSKYDTTLTELTGWNAEDSPGCSTVCGDPSGDEFCAGAMNLCVHMFNICLGANRIMNIIYIHMYTCEIWIVSINMLICVCVFI